MRGVHRRLGHARVRGLLAAPAFRACQHDLRPQCQRLRGLRPPRPPGQLIPLGLSQREPGPSAVPGDADARESSADVYRDVAEYNKQEGNRKYFRLAAIRNISLKASQDVRLKALQDASALDASRPGR